MGLSVSAILCDCLNPRAKPPSDAKIRGALYKLHNEQGQAPLIFAHHGAPEAPRC